jgi:hypothetical protein
MLPNQPTNYILKKTPNIMEGRKAMHKFQGFAIKWRIYSLLV